MTGDWKRSSYCGTNACVEVAERPDGTVRVRDSKHPEREPLTFDPAAWAEFVHGVRDGEFGGTDG